MVRLDRPRGSSARNVGVAQVTTPYVAFADDDSWWAPGALAAAADLFDRSSRGSAWWRPRCWWGPSVESTRCRPRWPRAPSCPCGDVPGLPVIGFLAVRRRRPQGGVRGGRGVQRPGRLRRGGVTAGRRPARRRLARRLRRRAHRLPPPVGDPRPGPAPHGRPPQRAAPGMAAAPDRPRPALDPAGAGRGRAGSAVAAAARHGLLAGHDRAGTTGGGQLGAAAAGPRRHGPHPAAPLMPTATPCGGPSRRALPGHPAAAGSRRQPRTSGPTGWQWVRARRPAPARSS